MNNSINNENRIDVSVIVPIFNTETWLEACLDSVISQTFRSIEIVLVNDGSTDRSPTIIKSYAAKDDRIVTISQPNRGVSAARNAGLKAAKGEYILFVDSDDTIRNDAVAVLYQQAVTTDADIVIGNAYYYSSDGSQTPLYQGKSMYAEQPLQTGNQCFSYLMEDNIFTPLVYLYFTRRTFILKHALFFEEGIIQEDELWCIKSLIQADRVSVSLMDFCHYYYRIRQGSLIRSDNKQFRVSSYFRVVRVLEKFIGELMEKEGNREYMRVIGWVQVRLFYIYHCICKLLKEMKEETNEYRAYFDQKLKQIRPELSLIQYRACLNYFRFGNELLYTRSKGLSLSFCITCKNRFHQISQTLPQNLKDNRDAKDVVEFILVDFGSTDGLQEWIAEKFTEEIESGYLKYCYTEELPFWHCSIAKNTAHILANNRIVVNLDCDNFTGKDGGLFVIDNMLKYGPESIILHQFSNEWDGTYGRIALSKSNFLKLGGYDESFEPAAYQDTDLLLRAQLMKIQCISQPDARYSKAIPNTIEEKMAYTSSNLSWEGMDIHNYRLSLQHISSGKLRANMDKDHIGIIDNIYTFE